MIDPVSITEVRTFIAGRKQGYQVMFANAQGMAVLEDLEKFARYGVKYSTFHPDQRQDDMYAGRQDMVKRIRQHLELPLDDLIQLFAPEAHAAMMAAIPGEEDDA